MIVTLRSKILLIATAVMFIAIDAIVFTSSKLSAQDYKEALQSRSLAIAKSLTIQLERLLQFGLSVEDIAGFEDQCQEIVDLYSGIEIALVADNNGNILFHSKNSKEAPNDQLLMAITSGREGIITRKTENGIWHSAVVPAFNPQKKHAASVIVAFPDEYITSSLSKTFWLEISIGASILLAGLLLLYITLFRYVSRPLSNLLTTVMQLRQPPLDLTRRTEVSTKDELGQLGTAFNQLMEALQETTVSKTELESAMEELKRLSLALSEQKEQLEVTLHSIGDAVISVDDKAVVRYLNPAAEALSGWSKEESEGLPLKQVLYLFNSKDNQPIPSPFKDGEITTDGLSNSVDIALRRRDGKNIAIDYTASPIQCEQGYVSGGVIILRDVSKEREMSQRLSWEATHDALTGLFNRREFNVRLEEAQKQAQKTNRQHILCFLDLDRFKVVNDTAGHTAGDELLTELAKILIMGIRPTDTLARLGGDEFAILLEDCSVEQANNTAAKLLSSIQGFSYQHCEHTFSVGVSIGIAKIDGTANCTEILTMADAACYMAKEQGRNRICVYRKENSEAFERRQHAEWVNKIHHALANNRFSLYFQTYLPLKNHLEQRQHMEVLIRMLDNNNNIVPPLNFLPAAERYGLMPQIDRWVINKVFSSYHRLVTVHQNKALTCAINLSGSSLNQESELLTFIQDQAKEFSIPEKAICFEITESIAINKLSNAAVFIQGCKSMGFLFALDDFGTGVSSFSYLKSLPIDFLKIDGSFVKNIVNDQVDRAMTETINRIGQIMGIHTVAEYAENQKTIDILKGIGVDYAQGFGVHIPEPLSLKAPE